MHICKVFFSELARHNKTGNLYRVCTQPVIDCTNSRDGTECIIYERDGKIFVREAAEFKDKFSMLNNAKS